MRAASGHGAGRARAHMAARERQVFEPCQRGAGGAAVVRAGQVVESAWVVASGLRGFHEAVGIQLRHRWRANFGVVRQEWRDLA